MAGKAGGQQSVVDGLKTVFTDVAQLLMLPDSAQHMQFLTGLMGQVQQYVMSKGMAAMGQPMPGGPPGGGAGAPGGPTPPGMPAGSGGPTGPPRQGPPPGAGGPMPGPSTAPNPDELRRVLAMTGGAG